MEEINGYDGKMLEKRRNFTWVMNSVAKARPAVTKVKEEMIEDDISDDGDPHLKVTQLEFSLKTSTTTIK